MFSFNLEYEKCFIAFEHRAVPFMYLMHCKIASTNLDENLLWTTFYRNGGEVLPFLYIITLFYVKGTKAAALPSVQGAGLPPQDQSAGGQTPSALHTPGIDALYPIATRDRKFY